MNCYNLPISSFKCEPSSNAHTRWLIRHTNTLGSRKRNPESWRLTNTHVRFTDTDARWLTYAALRLGDATLRIGRSDTESKRGPREILRLGPDQYADATKRFRGRLGRTAALRQSQPNNPRLPGRDTRGNGLSSPGTFYSRFCSQLCDSFAVC